MKPQGRYRQAEIDAIMNGTTPKASHALRTALLAAPVIVIGLAALWWFQ